MTVADISATTWISIVALLISAIGMIRAFSKDSTEDTTFNVTMSTKLDSISQGVDDIRVEMRAIREKQSDMGARLSALEANFKNLAIRVENVEKKG